MSIFKEDSKNDLVVDGQANADLIITHGSVHHILAAGDLGVLDDHLIGLAGSTHDIAFSRSRMDKRLDNVD